MEKSMEILNGHFQYKVLEDGEVDGSKVICSHCQGEFSYHRSTSSLKYHLNAKHTVDPSKSYDQTHGGASLRQTTLAAGISAGISFKYNLNAKHAVDEKKTYNQTHSEARLRQTTQAAGKDDEKLTDALAKWIATDCRPVSVVEDVGLRNVLRISTHDDRYETPSRHTITQRIHELYEHERTAKATALQRAPAVALTGDYWTSLGNRHYLGVTVHYIDEKWALRSHALAVMETEERRDAETCAGHFTEVAQQWNVSYKVTTLGTDGARSMITALRQLPYDHVPCFAHSLQRSLTASLQDSAFDNVLATCRQVVGHFKHSPASAAELEQKQGEHGQKKESLMQDVHTRWNSTLDMIKSIRRNEQPLRDVLTANTNIVMPTTDEMDKLQRLETLLEPCRYLTELLGGEKYVSCSAALPAFCHLSRVMESSDDDPGYVTEFKSTFRNDMEARKGNANIAYLKIATALDPRFKNLKCLPRAERSEVWTSVINLVKEQRVIKEEPWDEEYSPPKKKLTLLAVSSESDSEQEEDSIENSVHRYKAEPAISSDSCPLEWWSKHAGSHSRLAPCAQKYLATPATSVPCERLFSLAGHIVQKKRASLSSEDVNTLVCLSNWFSAEE